MALAGGVEEAEVEAPVGLQLGRDVGTFGGVDAVLGRDRDPLQRVLVEQRQGAPRRPLLEQRAQVVDLAQVVDVELGDEVAAAGEVGDLALLLEHRQRFADGGEADPERGGQLLLADLVARGEGAGDQRPAQTFDRVLGGRRRAGRRGARRRGGRRAQRNAPIPVIVSPMTRAWTSAVPS